MTAAETCRYNGRRVRDASPGPAVPIEDPGTVLPDGGPPLYNDRDSSNDYERLPMRRPVAPSLVLAMTLPLLAGCGGGLDERNVSRLKVGMTSQEVEAILGKGGKEVGSDEVAALLREALTPQGAPTAKGPKLEPDVSGARGVRWGSDSKSVTVIYAGDRVSRVFKKGF